MKYYPQNIKAAILDSVVPPIADLAGFDSNTFGPVLDRLFEACIRYTDCSTAYPDLRDRLLHVLEKLAEEPVVLEIVNLEDREPLYARIDHNMFLEIIRSEMYHTERLPNLPILISGVAQGEYWRLKAHVENTVYSGWPDDFDMGATLAIMCNDDVDVVNRPPNFDDAVSYPYLKDYAASVRKAWPCAIWPTKTSTGNRDVVTSDVPSLLLAGALDASTTTEQAELAAETLSVSHLFVFPASAHVQIRYNECSWRIIDEFLSRPTRRPNPKCLTSLRQPAFLTYGGS
jgi:pimeloyl-ACP methyl ester carboxylesterase